MKTKNPHKPRGNVAGPLTLRTAPGGHRQSRYGSGTRRLHVTRTHLNYEKTPGDATNHHNKLRCRDHHSRNTPEKKMAKSLSCTLVEIILASGFGIFTFFFFVHCPPDRRDSTRDKRIRNEFAYVRRDRPNRLETRTPLESTARGDRR